MPPPVTIARSPRRDDIQVLRALAVGAVLLYHAGIPFVPGGFVGVDVFFVVSGFLITNHLLAEVSATGRVSFGRFYARRARRILPAALVVLVLTTCASMLLAPRLLQPGILADAAASSVFGPNIRFAVEGLDYLADSSPSPLRHYWSLGVEEQFYALWPLVVLGLWRLARGSRRVVGVVVAVLVALSFAGSVALTQTSQPIAFFSLPTRAWELGAGALLAIAGPAIATRMPRSLAVVGAWVGFGGILAAIVLLDAEVAFPGWAAALPVAATALVILIGAADPAGGPGRILAARPVLWIGDISFALYLVHWPILVLAQLVRDPGEPLPLTLGVALAMVSIAVAAVLHGVVERPFHAGEFARRLPSRRVLVAGVAASVLLGAAALGGSAALASAPVTGSAPAVAAADPGARPELPERVPVNLSPSLDDAADDIPQIYSDGCHLQQRENALQERCRYGDADAGERVVLFGDSHAAQWFPAFDALGERDGFALDVRTKSSCPAVEITIVDGGVPDVGCDAWRDAALAELAADPPDRIVISSFAHYGEQVDREAWGPGLEATLGALPAESEVVLIADTPMFDESPSVCLSAHLDDVAACAVPADDAFDRKLASIESAVALEYGATLVDLEKVLCGAVCSPVLGAALVYRDAHHLTASAAARLADPLAERLGWQD